MASNLCYVTEAVLTKQKIEPDKVDRLKEGWTKSGNGRAKLSKRSSRKEC